MKKTNSWNRLLSLALCICMVLSLMPASALSVFATEGTDTAVSYAAKIGDTYYPTLAQAAGAVTEDSNTIEVLTDVTIDADETVTFAAFAQLSVADGKTITCNGTVMIGEDEGIIFENTLYYYGGDVTNEGSLIAVDPTYFTAGNGYTIGQKKNDTQTFVVEMVNASVNREHGHGIFMSSGSDEEKMHIKFSGTNTIAVTGSDSGAADAIRHETAGGLHDVIISGMEGAVLNISVGDAPHSSEGIRGKSVTITGGTVNVASGNVQDGLSSGIVAASVVVEEGATLNLTVGKAEVAVGSAGLVSGAGTINGLVVVPADNAGGFAFAASGNTVLIADFSAVGFGEPIPFSVPEDTTLTVKENVTLDLSGLTVADFTFAGTVINHGIILLPADFALDDAPKSGTIRIGEKGYIYDSVNGKWYCTEDSHTGGTATCTEKAVCDRCGISYGEVNPDAHSGGTATCTTQAVCETCGASYGEVDSTNHDKTVSFDDNGFCPNGCYEEAVWNEEDGVYEISNAGQLYWYAQYLNTTNAEIFAELTADIVIPENAPNWEPINASYAYFNGNFHTISGLKCIGGDAQYVGLFGMEGWWYEISNLRIDSSYFEGSGYVGAVVACMTNGGSITNCAVTNTTVQGDGDSVGTLAGYLSVGSVVNCFVDANTLAGGYTNGYVTIENSYYLSETETEDGGKTAEQFASGEVAYLLQSAIAGEDLWDEETGEWIGTAEPELVWGQTVGQDAYPVLKGQKVYENLDCAGAVAGYANEIIIPEHSFVQGYCRVCGEPLGDAVLDGVTYVFGGVIPLRWYLNRVEVPTYWVAGDGYVYFDPAAKLLTLDNATVYSELWSSEDSAVYWEDDLVINFSGTNTMSANDHNNGIVILVKGATVMNGIGKDAVLNINSGADEAARFGSLTVNSGTVSFVSKDSAHTSVGVSTVALTVAEGAVVNVTAGNANSEYGLSYGMATEKLHVDGTLNASYGFCVNERECLSCGVLCTELTGSGTINALMLQLDQENMILSFTACGKAVLASNWKATTDAGLTVTNIFTVAEGAILTIPEGVTLDLTVADFTFAGTVINHGIILLPADFALDDAPKSGTIRIGEKGYIYDSVDGKWYCTEDGHIGGTATCTARAVCETCGASYGELDPANHDKTVSFDDNGFCPGGCYEPAILNADGYYEISNAGQLYWFMEKVNSGDNAINGVLTADIVVNRSVLQSDGTLNGDGTNFRAWFPIGYWYDRDENGATEEVFFCGTFDGQGHTISGLYFNNQNQVSVGLFGEIDSNATIKNVGVIASYFNCSGDVGGVVGYNAGGTIMGCYSNAAITSTTQSAGGVVGNNDGTVTNCYNTGSITSTSYYIGGVVGNNTETVTNCYNTGTVTGSEKVGGVVGDNTKIVTNCYNTGAVTGSEKVGGVVGNNTETVTDCYNTGSVSGSEKVGGVVGYRESGTITNCYNTGAVTGTNYVGGVVGYSDGRVQNCYNTGSVSGSGYYVGGVVGYVDRVILIKNCYYLSGCATDGSGVTQFGVGHEEMGSATADDPGCVDARTATQFASGEVAYLLNGDQTAIVFKQTIGTDASPNFTGKTVYYGYTFCGDTEMVYTNDANAVAQKPAHIGGTATCSALAVCTVCGGSYGELDPANHDKTVSFDDNGFCPGGCYEPAILNADGYYEISNAGQLYWFMEKVNSGDNTINGVLTADIVVNRSVLQSDGTLNGDGTNFRAWFPIGYWHDCDGDGATEDLFFSGVFDGRGHTVSGLYFNNQNQVSVGLFGEIDSNATVKNVGVIDSYLNGNDDVGAVAGYNEGAVTDCYSKASVSSGDGMIGGVVGENQGAVENCYHTGAVIGNHQVGGVVGSNDGTVTNCYHTGTVSGENYVGGAVGENSGAVTNCYNTGSVSGGEKVGGVVGYNEGTVTNCHNTGAVSCSGRGIGGVEGGNTGAVTNCYYLDTCGASGNGTAKTADQFASGEVAYLLNGDQTTIVFKQTIGTDASPNFTGKTVYYGYPSCAEDAQLVYSNNETIRPDHSYENGICASCGAYESAVLNDGIYTISNAGQLLWFAELVNAGDFTAGAVLTSDIDMDGLHWTPIGTQTAYTGTFDGRGFAIKNLWQNSDGTNGNKNGLVVILGAGGTVMGVTIDHAAIWGADLYSTNATGAIANRNAGVIRDCVVKNSSIQQGAYEYLGGIAGENSGTIENCAVIGCSFSRRWGGTDSGSMGAIAQTNNGAVKNCFSYGCSFNNGRADKAAIVAVNNGTLENCYYYTTGTVATTYGTAKTAPQFASGEVAYLLGEAFGQTIGADGHPILGGKKVYYGYVSCADDAVKEYTNNENASAEKPDHTGTLGEYELTADGAQHARKWSCCGSVVTEKHSTTADGDKAADCNSKAYCSVCKSEYGEADPANHDKTVHFDDNGFCPNGCYEPATLNADGYYEISNAGQLYWFAAKLSYEDATLNGILTADIVVNRGTMTAETTDARVWIRIMARYNGTFDGNNKTISGLYFNDRDATYVGLFSFNQGTVKNVGVINSYFGANGNVGSIAGYNSGTVTNCYSTGTVSGNEKVSGVVGNNTGTVTNCHNTGTVSGSNNVGGVVGDNTGTVTNCYNTGSVSGSNDVGGVVGNNAEIVTNCYNTGSVNGNNDVGGVAGNNDGTVTNCYNTGSVNGNEKVGGVAGYNDNSITDCYSIGSVSGTGFHIGGVVGYSEFGTMTNCYNTGSVSGSYNVGSVVGDYKFLTLKNCYYLSGCATDGSGVTQFGVGHQEMGSTTADDPGCVDAKTATQFASGEVAYLLGEAFGQTIGADGHPILGGKKVYQVTNCKGETAYSNTEENGAHTEQTVTGKAPTCTEPGLTDGMICSVCGQMLVAQKVIPATGHSYDSDVCTVCGHIGVPVKLDSARLSFKEKIHYNIFFYLGVGQTVELADMGLILFDSLNSDGTVDDAIAIYSGAVQMDGKYMVATDGIHAKRMGDTIYFRVYAKLADGSYVYSKTVEYSAVTYAQHILKGNYSDSDKALVVAMLNYGAQAQRYFGYNTENPVNAGLTEEQQALVKGYESDLLAPVQKPDSSKTGAFASTGTGFAKKAPAVSFEGSFLLNYFFTPSETVAGDMTLYYWTEADYAAATELTAENATGSIVMTPGAQYHGVLDGIYAKDADATVYVAAVYSDGTATHCTGILPYSIGAYLTSHAAKETNFRAMAQAAAVYCSYCKEYFKG